MLTQKDEANESPAAADLHPVGCAAQLLAVIPGAEGALWIVVRAVQWVHLGAIERAGAHWVARVSGFVVEQGDKAEVARLEQTLREHVRAAAAKQPDPAQLLRMTERMTAAELADITLANLPCSVQEKARYASEPSLVARLQYVIALAEQAA